MMTVAEGFVPTARTGSRAAASHVTTRSCAGYLMDPRLVLPVPAQHAGPQSSAASRQLGTASSNTTLLPSLSLHASVMTSRAAQMIQID